MGDPGLGPEERRAHYGDGARVNSQIVTDWSITTASDGLSRHRDHAGRHCRDGVRVDLTEV